MLPGPRGKEGGLARGPHPWEQSPEVTLRERLSEASHFIGQLGSMSHRDLNRSFTPTPILSRCCRLWSFRIHRGGSTETIGEPCAPPVPGLTTASLNTGRSHIPTTAQNKRINELHSYLPDSHKYWN